MAPSKRWENLAGISEQSTVPGLHVPSNEIYHFRAKKSCNTPVAVENCDEIHQERKF